jgi:HSP20 family protein
MNELTQRRDPLDIFSRFGDFADRDFFSQSARSEWLPPVDIKETDGGYTFSMDVPGLKPEDLDVELHNGVLTIEVPKGSEPAARKVKVN